MSDPVYPLPAVSTKINATLSPAKIAFALAPLPPPPLKVTTGSLVYPEPPEVTVMPVKKPAVIVATAVAGSLATTLAQTIAIKMKAANSLRGKFTHLISSFELRDANLC
ncbi:hypothetical protein [Prosthecobacter sp.]